MAYKTYTTDAFVIGSEDRLTADRVYMLFTREAGLIYARAVSVRREASKLRYGLQDFSCVRVSLVRGKAGWKVTGAERAYNLYFSTDDRQIRAALLRIFRLMRRLVRGEETHIGLYDVLADGLAALALSEADHTSHAERILTLRLLFMLGYVEPKDAYRSLLGALTLSEALEHAKMSDVQDTAIRTAIGDALEASHL